jgi:hypothetical protein
MHDSACLTEYLLQEPRAISIYGQSTLNDTSATQKAKLAGCLVSKLQQFHATANIDPYLSQSDLLFIISAGGVVQPLVDTHQNFVSDLFLIYNSVSEFLVLYDQLLRLDSKILLLPPPQQLPKSETSERWNNKLLKHAPLEKYRSIKLATLTQPAVYRDTFAKYPSQFKLVDYSRSTTPMSSTNFVRTEALALLASFHVFQQDTAVSETSVEAPIMTTAQPSVPTALPTAPTDGRLLSANVTSSTTPVMPTNQFALPARVVVPQFNDFVVQRNLYRDYRRPSAYAVDEQQHISRWTDNTDYILDQRYLDMIHLHTTAARPFQVGDQFLFLYSQHHQFTPSDPWATLFLMSQLLCKIVHFQGTVIFTVII